MRHYLVLVMAVAAATAASVHVNEIDEEKTLKLAFLINRHGERSPDELELSFADDPEAIENVTRLEGLEGLTNMGKRRAYTIGKFIRKRYGQDQDGLKLISNLYLKDEIAVRSTDKERTKMTALVAMAAVYPPEKEQQWDDGIGNIWQPVPYTAVPLNQDFLRYYSNCREFEAHMAQAKEESILEEFLPYADLFAQLENQTGKNFTDDPLLLQALYDLFKSEKVLGVEIPEWGKRILPRLTEAVKLAYQLYFRNDRMKQIGGGVLLDQFLTAAVGIAQGEKVIHRLRMFSAHDFNIGSLMAVSRSVMETRIPEYGTAFALELYEHKNGAFSVQPIYWNESDNDAIEIVLPIDACGSPCYLERFRSLTKKFVLPEKEFYEICDIKKS